MNGLYAPASPGGLFGHIDMLSRAAPDELPTATVAPDPDEAHEATSVTTVQTATTRAPAAAPHVHVRCGARLTAQEIMRHSAMTEQIAYRPAFAWLTSHAG